MKALTAWNVKVVGVANNVAYDRSNILQTLNVLDANGIAHTGGGTNIAEAHKPAIVERKGVKIGFLQYTARWYQDNEQIATDTEPGVAKISSRDGITIDPADVDRVRDDIRRLRSQVDIVVVSHHNRDGATATQFGESRPRGRPPASAATTTFPSLIRSSSRTWRSMRAPTWCTATARTPCRASKSTKASRFSTRSDIRPSISPDTRSRRTASSCDAVIDGKKIVRVSFVPVTRDAHNDVLMLDPSTGEGAALLSVIKGLSGSAPLRDRRPGSRAARHARARDASVTRSLWRPASAGRRGRCAR